MDIMSQRDAIYLAVSKILEANGKSIQGSSPVSLSAKEKDQVITTVVLMFQKGLVKLSDASREKYAKSERDLIKYVKSLLTNWLARDPRLNGEISNQEDRYTSIVHELHFIKSKLSEPNEIRIIDDILSEHIDVSLIPSTILENV